MFRRFVLVAGLCTLAVSAVFADFSYQETSKITGGSMVAMLKMAGVFSKQARQVGEPIQSTVAIKGDKMIHRNAQHASIIDLGNETITSIDLQKKTYSVMTFAEMKQAMEQMSQKMQQQQKKNSSSDQADVKFKVSAKSTGNHKQINGYEAAELIIKMEMEGTDKKSGQSGSMVVVADTWHAPDVAGYKEVREFYRKMAAKIDWTPNGNMFMGRPDMMQGMSEVAKESAKIEGVPVYQVVTMGAEGTVSETGSTPQPGVTSQPSQPAQDRPSVGSALGGALGGRFGLGKKKPQQQDTPPPSSSSNADSGPLIEMTSETTGFSSAPVDGSQFEIPAGFKKVDNELKRAAQ